MIAERSFGKSARPRARCDASSMTEEELFTNEDISALNDESIARSAAILRLVGSALVVAGAIGALAWLWFEVRTQQRISNSPLELNVNRAAGGGLDVVDRIDVFAPARSAR